ncbi:4022_t:CDS:1 [Dentiscutata heterogama]|uniref:4022_t:CDS:1 n=1 Tax=Dentiscutata heterogama TaxID=1316150 RepID=A0ACA9JVQ4_9GLOM|nr:4022_t:CDS:1 [Dentiscutata heterogama]
MSKLYANKKTKLDSDKNKIFSFQETKNFSNEGNKTKTNTTSMVEPVVNKFTSFELEDSTASWANQVENEQKYQTETLKTPLTSRKTHNNNENLENNKHTKDTGK